MTEKSTKDDYDDCNDNFHSNDGNFDHNDDKNDPKTYNAMPENKFFFDGYLPNMQLCESNPLQWELVGEYFGGTYWWVQFDLTAINGVMGKAR